MSLWPQAILFDFDGVLVNSEPLHFWAFQEVLRAEKITVTEQEYYSEYVGCDDRNAFARVFEKNGREFDPRTRLRVLTAKKEKMRAQIDSRKYQALPGVEGFVRALWRNYPLGVCSGSLRDEVELMLEGVALRDCFPVVTAAEDVTVGKPDPQGYLVTMKKLSEKLRKGIRPGDCLVIEDAPAVIRNVRAVGFPVLAVTTSHPPDRLREAQANWITKSLDCDAVQKILPGLRMTR